MQYLGMMGLGLMGLGIMGGSRCYSTYEIVKRVGIFVKNLST